MPDDQRLIQAVNKVGEWKLASAFKQSTFVYGTLGKGSAGVAALKIWAAQSFTPEEQGIGRELNLFDPGPRAGTYLSGNGYQMMDMYYGQAGNNLYLKRNPAIAEFVHYAMNYKGPFSMNQSGRDAFQTTYKTTLEGWQLGGPTFNGTTATVEISRLIRWGIQRFGGKIVFEGKQIYYSQVFNKNGYKADTDREAIALFAHFSKGVSSAKFGKGTIGFLWNGREIAPTHCHFLSNWGFPLNERGNVSRVKQTAAILEKGSSLRSGNSFSAKEPWQIGALQHTPLNRGNLESWLKQKGVVLNEELWNKFREKPAGLEAIPTEKILVVFAKGLSLGYI